MFFLNRIIGFQDIVPKLQDNFCRIHLIYNIHLLHNALKWNKDNFYVIFGYDRVGTVLYLEHQSDIYNFQLIVLDNF